MIFTSEANNLYGNEFWVALTFGKVPGPHYTTTLTFSNNKLTRMVK